MARRTKEEIRIAKNETRLDELVKTNKYLAMSVHHKNNYWSWAAWDSWAAQGKAGSCGCGCGHYNGTLKNKRAKTERGGKNEKYPVDVSRNMCSDCVRGIEKRLGVSFPRH